MVKKENKALFFERLLGLFDNYDRMLIVSADNVGSKQLQGLRKAFRKDSEMIMGKNTMIRKVLRDNMEEKPELESLYEHIEGNIGFIFTKAEPSDIRELLRTHVVPAAAKAGTFAQCDVNIPPGPTGMDPSMTSFFQALNIPTKISRGQIEIQNEVALLKEGQKVGSSEVALLQKLSIRPFSYGLGLVQIYEKGNVFSPKVLDIKDEDMIESIKAVLGDVQGLSIGADYPTELSEPYHIANVKSALEDIAAISLEIGYPTEVSVPHSIKNGLEEIISISLEIDYTPKEAETIKEMLANPEAFAAAAHPAAAAAPAAEASAAEAEKPAEEEEEEDDDMGFSLFD
uniref:Large ribosomal subunit protein uL10-like insertion domain-containing protein n=1 Tax=Rhodosorus marinus TaxID=101924 RepID=A0A7S2ZKM0_9RHOD|mmetsp:Transcript_21647/g.88297  ORF Transcript_21647/g.88297 Transcript_21647/m.88297 type:complete len:343 (+) Transcript_21647:278-1306(+)